MLSTPDGRKYFLLFLSNLIFIFLYTFSQKTSSSSPNDNNLSGERSQPQGSKGNSRVEEEDSSNSLESIVMSIGLVNNPITKASAGGELHRYHTLLAQQVFVVNLIYCFFFLFWLRSELSNYLTDTHVLAWFP